MEYKIIWSDDAICDLSAICTFIARQNPKAASETGRGILDHVNILASFPFIGPVHPRGSGGSLREIVFRSYRIFYDVSDSTPQVQILHVWHGAREEPLF